MESPCHGLLPVGHFVAEDYEKPVVLTWHARIRLRQRGATEESVVLTVRIGAREPAQRGLLLHRDPAKGIAAATGRRKPVERAPEWRSRRWAAHSSMQVAAVVAHEPDRLVVVTVYTFFFTQPELPP